MFDNSIYKKVCRGTQLMIKVQIFETVTMEQVIYIVKTMRISIFAVVKAGVKNKCQIKNYRQGK